MQEGMAMTIVILQTKRMKQWELILYQTNPNIDNQDHFYYLENTDDLYGSK
jgi:hypothetical protein